MPHRFFGLRSNERTTRSPASGLAWTLRAFSFLVIVALAIAALEGNRNMSGWEWMLGFAVVAVVVSLFLPREGNVPEVNYDVEGHSTNAERTAREGGGI